MSWGLYLYKTEDDFTNDNLFRSPAEQECKQSRIPRVGEYVTYYDEDETCYESEVVRINYSYQTDSIGVEAIIREEYNSELDTSFKTKPLPDLPEN